MVSYVLREPKWGTRPGGFSDGWGLQTSVESRLVVLRNVVTNCGLVLTFGGTKLVACTTSALFSISLLAACGEGGASSAPPPPPTITSVIVSTNYAVVQPGQIVQFIAKVQGTGNFNASVTWSVNGILGGDAANGKIRSGCLQSTICAC